MSSREYVKFQADTLPEQVIERVIEFISFQRFRLGLFENDTEYLMSIPGMVDKIESAVQEPLSDCVTVAELWPNV